MGLFTRKPSRDLAAELTRQAASATAIFAYALKHKKSMPRDRWPDEGLDLTVRENRNAIRDELIRIILDYGLEGCPDKEIGGARLVPLASDQSSPTIIDVAVSCALAINTFNYITRLYYEEFPKFRPLYEMVDNFAKIGCSGGAQAIGTDLPPEVVRTWPYYARIFEQAKSANLPLWPRFESDCE